MAAGDRAVLAVLKRYPEILEQNREKAWAEILGIAFEPTKDKRAKLHALRMVVDRTDPEPANLERETDQHRPLVVNLAVLNGQPTRTEPDVSTNGWTLRLGDGEGNGS